MITGIVNANREAILQLTVIDTGGQEHQPDAVVDTGFDAWLSLPPQFIKNLGLLPQRSGRAMLADGSEALFAVYEATVRWDGQPRLISIYEMDAEPLIGMSLMYGYELVLPILDGATFTLRRINNP